MMLSMRLILQTTFIDQTCTNEFQAYKLKFNKTYYEKEEQQRLEIFCKNYFELQNLLKANNSLPIGIVERMDSINQHNKNNQQLNKLDVARSDYCSAINPLKSLPTLLTSVDLREMQLITKAKNQGDCISGYAFTTISLYENSILRDKSNLNTFWQQKATASTLNLSEQFQLSNAICDNCYYCSNGNFVFQAYITVPGNKLQKTPVRQSIQTVELTSNFPYDYQSNQQAWLDGSSKQSLLDTNNYLLPMQYFNNSGINAASCNLASNVTPVIKIFDDDSSTFNLSTLQTIKSYLSRGIAISLTMNANAALFTYYTGGGQILHSDCVKWTTNHAVTLIGYGRKSGKDVWILKNSYGSSWGDNGIFFVEIGRNSFCIEQYAYTIIPKYYNVNDTSLYQTGTLSRGTDDTLDCDNYFTNISNSITCYNICPNDYPYSISGVFQCFNICPEQQLCSTTCYASTPYNENDTCTNKCSSGYYIQNNNQLMCTTGCSSLYVINVTNGNTKQCVTSCPSTAQFSDAGSCIATCSTGYYSIVSNVLTCQAACPLYYLNTTNGNTKQCVTSCPSTAQFSDAGSCIATCSTGYYSIISNVLTCQAACPLYYLNTTNGNTKQCVTSCPSTAQFSDAGSCIATCSTGYYSIVSNILTCQAACSLYYLNTTNGNTKQCVTSCPSTAQFSNAGSCIATCSTGYYSIVSNILTCQAACSLYYLNTTNGNTKQCVTSCPSTAQFSDAGSCIATCSTGYYSIVSNILTCQAACSLYYLNTTNGNTKQCVTSCPSTAQFSNAGSCIATCSTGYYSIVSNILTCQAACSLYYLNTTNGNTKQCVTSCPSTAQFSDAGSCIATCSTGYYSIVSNILTCQAACSLYYLNTTNGNTKQCVTSCPSTAQFSNAGSCIATCSTGYYSIVSNILTCQAACPLYYLNTTNGNTKQCVTSCPADNKYIESGQCVKSCSSGSFTNVSNVLTCSGSCPLYVIDAANGNAKVCVTSCPSDAPYSDGGSCIAKCSSGYYQNISSVLTCQAACSLYVINVTNGNTKQCVTSCPSTAQFSDAGSCIATCSTGYYSIVSNVLTCQAACSLYYLNTTNGNTKQCVTSCPSTAQFSDAGSCIATCSTGYYSIVSNILTCQAACPLYYLNTTNGNTKQCVTSCPSTAQFSDAGSCIATCSTGYYSIVSNILTCQAACSLYYLNTTNGNTKQCVTSCPSTAQFSDAGSCIATCSTGYYSIISNVLTCQAACPLYYLNTTNGNTKQCVTSCPSTAQFSDAGSCIATCSTGYYSIISNVLTCQAACPLYYLNTTNGNTKQCVTSCPADSKYIESGQCVKSCSSGSFTNVSNVLTCSGSCPLYVIDVANGNAKVCVTSCPSDAPYSDGGSCIAKCSSGYYQNISSVLTCQAACSLYVINVTNGNTKQCVTSCPSTAQFSNAGSCIATCSTGYYSIVSNVLTCQAACPLYYLNTTNGNTKQCVTSCPSTAQFSDAGSCIATCSTGYYSIVSNILTCQAACSLYYLNTTNGNTKQCVTSCPSTAQFSDAGSCIATCSTGYYSIISNILTCQAACSLYYLNTTNGNTKQCVTSCPADNKYIESGQCVKSCSSGSFTNVSNVLTCSGSCPLYVIDAANGNAKVCVTSCPSDAPYSDGGSCIAKCSSGYYQNISSVLTCQAACSLYVINVTNGNTKQCVTSCPSTAQFSDAGSCIATCSTGYYSIVSNVLTCQAACSLYYLNTTNGNTKQCVTSCPSTAQFSNAGSCIATCSTGYYSIVSNILTCQAACSLYYLNTTNGNTKQCVTSCPSTAQFSNAGSCIATCSTGYYSIVSNVLTCQAACSLYYLNTTNGNTKQCVTSCPSTAQFSNAGSCIATCSTGYYSIVSNVLTCQAACSLYYLNTTNGNTKQCVTSCPSTAQFSDAGSCIATCSTGYYSIVSNILTCQAACSLYYLNTTNGNTKQCVTSCPSTAQFSDAGSCIATCSTGYYSIISNVLTCQAACPLYYLNTTNGNTKQCVTSCPADNKYIESGQCVKSCSSGSFTNVSNVLTCSGSCPLYVIDAANGNAKVCVTSCPSDAPYSDGGSCIAKCSSGYYQNISSVLTCQAACSLYVINVTNGNTKQCVTSCPSTAQFSDAGSCIATCSTGYYSIVSNILTCQAACSLYYLNTTNGNTKQCVTSCPSTAQFSNAGSCIATCSTGYYSIVSNVLTCQAACPLYYLNTTNGNTKQCVTSCPSTAQFSDAGSCIATCSTGYYSIISNVLTCQAACPLYYLNTTNGNTKQCVTSCPADNKYIESGQCVKSCSSGSFTNVSNVLTCSGSCPLYVIDAANGNAKVCVTSCPSDAPYSDGGSCIAKCSSGYYQNISSVLTCQAACSLYVINVTNGNTKQCVTSCPSTAQFSDAGSCIATCSTGYYSIVSNVLTCQAACSLYYLNTTNGNTKQCVTSCPSTAQFSDAGSCIATCSTGYYSIVSNILTCQAACPLYYLNTTNGNTKQCVTSCPSTAQFSDAGSCVESCATGYYSINSDVLTCSQSCPIFYVNVTNGVSRQCVTQCPADHPYLEQGECVESCSSGAFINDSGVLTCSLKTLKEFPIGLVAGVSAAVIIIITIAVILLVNHKKKTQKLNKASTLSNNSSNQLVLKEHGSLETTSISQLNSSKLNQKQPIVVPKPIKPKLTKANTLKPKQTQLLQNKPETKNNQRTLLTPMKELQQKTAQPKTAKNAPRKKIVKLINNEVW
ncbi:Cathepsin_L [Hexamita inflata]|uniref:Cathepsin L n=1 Tax=Hexamita inflata TaxID=28002 RepID=A0AA86R5Y8_9EUKA|nr:Cathepsin L [Hexamita inflata]